MDVTDLPQPLRFEWDKGNDSKNFLKHKVNNQESEEAFLNFNIIWPDQKHSGKEARFNLLGSSSSNSQKILYITFTIRQNKTRIISARSADKYERKIYEKVKKNP